DVLKSVVAVAWLPHVGPAPGDALPWLQVACGAAAVVGHCYPAFFGFRGGKGMATLLGAYAILAPVVLLIVVLAWMLTLAITGYVGFATMTGAVAAPVFLATTGSGIDSPLLLFSLLMALFIVYTHRSNISRMRDGTESRIARALLSRRH
ncbi:MAG: glycerol-3-phosphate acyltransferase, partial [Chromatiales bacterium]|nr:glycerol-3-phosphate acyltransferase [Chromatiales bacterium]